MSWNYTKHANVFLYFFLDLLLVREVLFNKSCMFNSHTCYDGHNMHFKLEPFWYLHSASLFSNIRWVLAFLRLPWLPFRFRLFLDSRFPDFPYAQNKFGGESTGRFDALVFSLLLLVFFWPSFFVQRHLAPMGLRETAKRNIISPINNFRQENCSDIVCKGGS